MVELKVKDIIERKKLLIKGLEENIFKDFTESLALQARND